MAPLYVDESCLVCHKNQGYKVGGVRGGISINIPLGELDQKMKTNKVIITALLIITVLILLFILYFMVWKLVSRLQESQKQLKQLSVTDELTGLRNRRYIMERLEDEFQRARRSDKPMGLIMLDLDHFKQINDMHGHQFGDLVLKAVASRMRASIREYDLLGRVGGEEFFIVSPEAEVEETLRIAERIRELIRGEAISDGKREVTVTISAGVTMLKEHDRDIDVLFSRADTALYSAKQQGRDRVVVL
jgi:diguanylate cyclase (GGDEF)-like protein